jgi:threonine synthase
MTGQASLKKRVACALCGRVFDRQYVTFCECGGYAEVTYDLAQVRLQKSDNCFVRFRDLLPICDASLLPDSFTPTPLIHSKRLGAVLGLPRLYLKDETSLPTGTTKDRMAAVALAYLYESGIRTICTSSTGNSSTAFAHAVRRFPDMKICLFTAESFHRRVNYRDNNQIVHYVLRDATFVDAFNHASIFAKENGLTSERGFFNIGRREGLKLSFLEAVDQASEPFEWYVQAVSSAMGVAGVHQGAKQLQQLGIIPRIPRLMCVQQESCAPMARAWIEGTDRILPEHIVHHPNGLAEAILRGDPTRVYPIVRKVVRESQGIFEIADEASIREARSLLRDLEGIDACFSASAALAGLIQAVRAGRFPKKDSVIVNLTGRDRPIDAHQSSHQDIRWLVRAGDRFVAESMPEYF